jgi:replication-associated recombination protein RarA
LGRPQLCKRQSPGDEKGALYWSPELAASGFPQYVWKRLRIIASEDVGLVEPGLVSDLDALHRWWSELRTPKGDDGGIFLIHCVLMLVRAGKSRIVDHAYLAAHADETVREMPSMALDRHTARGRAMGRGWAHLLRGQRPDR